MTQSTRLFIGSATETKHIAEDIGRALHGEVEIHLWSEVFELGELNLQALQREAAECDFAIFVWGMEDTTVARGVSSGSPRDNVVYEAGLFAGSLGEQRVFVAHAEGTRIPSDYLGVTTATFDLAKPDVGSIAARIKSRIDQLGPKPVTFMSGHWWQIVRTEDNSAVLSFFTVKPQTDSRTVVMGGPAWSEGGKRIARWDTLATQFNQKDKTLHYSWEGTHPKDPGVPEYFGIGMIRYGLSPITGKFSSIRRHPGKVDEVTRWKSAFYYRADPDHVPIMASDAPEPRKHLIKQMLKRRDLDD